MSISQNGKAQNLSILNADSSTYDFYFNEFGGARVLIASESEGPNDPFPSMGIWNVRFQIEDPSLECRLQPVLNIPLFML
jgi:hypothetical protein|tara:strand:- start:536 stop:775 length:240 start_codon:yes stop_codon:yes gene_type:complete